MHMPNPDLNWYTSISLERKLLSRCPFASVHRCPRYYLSLSLTKHTGSLGIDEEEDRKLRQYWKASELWPRTEQQDTVVCGGPNFKSFSGFCPEVTFDRFGVFASSFSDYADGIDRERAHSALVKQSASRSDWRWAWEYLTPLHYSDCALFAPLSYKPAREAERERPDKILTVKPSMWGISLDVGALLGRLRRWYTKLRE